MNVYIDNFILDMIQYIHGECIRGGSMARNKFPEVTVEKILVSAQRLFLEKGYDNTTIQDIVDALGNLTKGAIYHHFKSKEEIMDALGKRMFIENNPFTEVKKRKDLNGLQKMREAAKLFQADTQRMELNTQSLPLLKNPRILAETIEANRTLISPLWQDLIEEGNRDGSIHTEYPKEISEVLQLLTNVWLVPSVFPATAEETLRKFRFLKEMLEKMGVPLFDEEMTMRIEGALRD